jgi:hypothetical protein
MRIIKQYLKSKLPSNLLFFIKYFRVYNSYRIIENVHKSNCSKNALLSYSLVPFTQISNSHTLFLEAKTWSYILFELGYNVDVCNFNNDNIDISKYDLICGFGDVFQRCYEYTTKKGIVTILYATGMHFTHQNYATLKRIKDVYHKKNVWLGKSSRYVEKSWYHQTMFSDGIIALGNETCADSYRAHTSSIVYSIPAPFFLFQDAIEIIKNRKPGAERSFLWFGSTGLIHKGLDLLLEYFSKNNSYTLHICGPISNESEFANIYKDELFNYDNIINHGFVDIKTEKFREILLSCSFTILPSCSEGGSPSVITTIGNGALIPIITKYCTIDTSEHILINELNYNGIHDSIEQATSLSILEIIDIQLRNLALIKENNSIENYRKKLKSCIELILKTKK